MKKENGMGVVAIFIIIIVIIMIFFFGYKFIKQIAKNENIQDIKANMLLIQGKCKVIEESGKVNKTEDCLKGKKVSDMKEDSIISEFLKLELLPEDKLEKYYVLTDEDLSNLNIDVKNEENSYYIVNYEDDSVFITKGYINEESNEIVYKLEQ